MSEEATQEATQPEIQNIEDIAFGGADGYPADVEVGLWADLEDEEKDWEDDLDALDTTLERHDVIVKFRNPKDPTAEVIKFRVRPMTPGELSVFQGSLFGHSLLEARRVEMGEGENDPIDLEMRQKLLDQTNAKEYDIRLLQILEDCILKPRGVSADRMKNWDPFFLQKLFDAAIGGMKAARAVDRFPKVDPQPNK